MSLGDQVNDLEDQIERLERAWERTEDRLINELNAAKDTIRELELEIARLRGERGEA